MENHYKDAQTILSLKLQKIHSLAVQTNIRQENELSKEILKIIES